MTGRVSRSGAREGWQKALLIRRALEKPDELSFYLTLAPEGTELATLVQVAGTRWTIEACFEAAKGEVGLDEYEVRSWTGWHRPVTLAMLAHAYLAVVRQHAIRGRGPRPRGRLAAPYGSRGAPAHLASRLGTAARSRSHPRLVGLATPTPAARQAITLDPQNQNSSTPAVELSSNSVVGPRMAVSLGVELSNRFVDGAVEVIRTVERLMSKVMPLQVAPETLDVVQLRSIFRQPLDPEPVGALGERGAACLAGVDRAVVEDQNEGLDRDASLGPIAPVDLLQESDEVRASFGPAGVNNEVATRPVEHAEHRHFGALARRRNAQVGPFLGPDMRQIGMGERFGLVREQKHDVTRLGLRFEQRPAQARPVHRVPVLATFQGVAGPSPAESPLFPQHDG